MQYAEIAVNTKTSLSRQTFTYKIKPEHLPYIQPGVLVLVPFRNRNIDGIILTIKSRLTIEDPGLKPSGQFSNLAIEGKLKSITKIIDTQPILNTNQLELAKCISNYYLAPVGDVLFMMVPPIAHRLTKKSLITNRETEKQRNRETKIYTIYESLLNRIGKYIKLTEKALKSSQNVLIIFPQILIESEIKNKFEKIFGKENIALIHGNLKTSERYKLWQDISNGKKKIVIGSRSAIFSPIKNLGLIIVDEPENFGYKEEQSPHYNTVEVAVKMSQIHKCNLIFGSIYPDLEAILKIKKKIYLQVNNSPVTEIIKKLKFQIIDLQFEKKIINYTLENNINEYLKKNKKVLLIIDRKGSGSYFICSDCKKIINCQRCNLPLVYFEDSNTLKCNHCNTNIQPPKTCSYCQGIKLKPFGIGTQTVEKEIKKLFPNIKILVIEKNITISDKQLAISDVVISTQKILEFDAKFDLTVLLQIDNQLNLPDFKANENVYLKIIKFTSMTKEKFIIQTYNPENYLIQNLRDPELIMRYILNERKLYNYPPFSKIIKLVFKDKFEVKCKSEAENMFNKLNDLITRYTLLVTCLGPNPCFIPKKRDKYYYQIILKYEASHNKVVKNILKKINELSGWQVDVDPISLL